VWRAVLATTGTPGLHETVAGVTVLDVTAPSSLALAVEGSDEPVLVVSHPLHAHATRVACATLAGHRPDLLVGHSAFAQAALASLVTLGIAREVARDAGHGAAMWRDLAQATWSGALVASVAKLTTPEPTLGQHVRSWFPGSQFLVRLHPEPRAFSAKTAATALTGVTRTTHDVYLSEVLPESPVIRSLVGALAPASVRQLGLPGDWNLLFGRQEELQIAVVPSEYLSLVRARGGPCSTCGLSAAESVCLFCRTRTGSGQAAAPAPDLKKLSTQHLSVVKDAMVPAGRTT
jgi:hypothetical protein